MATIGFDKLEIYRLAERLADRIWALVRQWEIFEQNTVGRQLVRAADSIGANIAEGTGRFAYKDNKRFVK